MTKISTLDLQMRRARRSPKPYTRDWMRKDDVSDASARPVGRSVRPTRPDAMQAFHPRYTVTTHTVAPELQRVDSEALIVFPEGYFPEADAYLLDGPPASRSGAARGAMGAASRLRSTPVAPPPMPVDTSPTASRGAMVDASWASVKLAAPAVEAPPAPSIPSVVSLTPGGAAWWKFGAAQPQRFEDVYLEPHQSFRHHPGLFGGPFQNILCMAAHAGRAAEVETLLASKDHKVERLLKTFDKLSAPTPEQTQYVHVAKVALQMYRACAALHALVGNAPLAEKIRTLHTLSTAYPDLLPNIRMMGLNLLHIACTMCTPPIERFLLVRYLKSAGVDPSGASETGLTPLHCLAAQPAGRESIRGLLGWSGGFTVNVNARNAAGETPLYIAYATQPHNTQLIASLQAFGAHVAMRTVRKDTMLHAVLRHGDHPQAVHDLIAQGLGVGHVDETGLSAVSLARQLGRAFSCAAIAAAYQGHVRDPLIRPRLGGTEKTTSLPPGPMIVPVAPPTR